MVFWQPWQTNTNDRKADSVSGCWLHSVEPFRLLLLSLISFCSMVCCFRGLSDFSSVNTSRGMTTLAVIGTFYKSWWISWTSKTWFIQTPFTQPCKHTWPFLSLTELISSGMCWACVVISERRRKLFPQEQRAAGERPKKVKCLIQFFSHRLAMCSLILIYLEDFACGECVTYYFKEDKCWFILVLFVLSPLFLGPCQTVAPAPFYLGQDWAFPRAPPSTSLPCLLVCGELRHTTDGGWRGGTARGGDWAVSQSLGLWSLTESANILFHVRSYFLFTGTGGQDLNISLQGPFYSPLYIVL